eukprot:TRINITY_DN16629_c0_g1_i1.p1 TRINITY_DN16629_c0_g1~~TRINITY_DN16629_c0_g1_i1.p1  ORF type:complete len:297 (-),score=76.34 TRINITY_DN16629_c0_g1_i1:48-938(-)
MVRQRSRLLALAPLLCAALLFCRGLHWLQSSSGPAFVLPKQDNARQLDAQPATDAQSRRAAMQQAAALLAAAGTMGLPPSPAEAIVTVTLRTAVSIYAEGIQRAADMLVFAIRPKIEKQDWEWVREYLRGDSYGNSKGYLDLVFPLDRFVIGNEELIEGSDEANLRMNALLIDMNTTVWGPEAQRQEKLLKAWDDATAIITTVMKGANGLVAEEPVLQKKTTWIPYKLPTKDPKDYQRTYAQWQENMCDGVLSSGICVPMPKGSDKLIAEGTQIGLKVDAALGLGVCDEKTGKCAR